MVVDSLEAIPVQSKASYGLNDQSMSDSEENKTIFFLILLLTHLLPWSYMICVTINDSLHHKAIQILKFSKINKLFWLF